MVVNTTPMLRANNLAAITDKAQISRALYGTRLMDEPAICTTSNLWLKTMVGFDGTSNHNADLDHMASEEPVKFDPVRTGRDEVALLGFTSGTTGETKATAPFHRDLLIIADGYAAEVLGVAPDAIFVGSPPLSFTFGLGGLAIVPLRFGATATLQESASLPTKIEIIQKCRATVCFTAPITYRVMLRAMEEGVGPSSLRAAVSAGEIPPAPATAFRAMRTALCNLRRARTT